MRLFVYGSMRVGEPNRDRLRQAGADYKGRAALSSHRLYTAFRPRDSRWIAYAVPEPGFAIVGDLFELAPHQIMPIDMAEGHPWFYRRETVMLHTLDGGKRVLSEAYVMPRAVLPREAQPCAQGDWLACRSGKTLHGVSLDGVGDLMRFPALDFDFLVGSTLYLTPNHVRAGDEVVKGPGGVSPGTGTGPITIMSAVRQNTWTWIVTARDALGRAVRWTLPPYGTLQVHRSGLSPTLSGLGKRRCQ